MNKEIETRKGKQIRRLIQHLAIGVAKKKEKKERRKSYQRNKTR